MKSSTEKKTSDLNAVTFTHLPIPNLEEFRRAAAMGNLSAYTEKRWGRCIRAFDECDNIHLAYLFLSDAYKAFVTSSSSIDTLVHLEVAIKAALNRLMQHGKNPGKFQVIGLEELKPLLEPLDKLAENSRIPLKQLVLGGGSELYYDCPKVVEAIIRVARRHKREPIFRFDVDVAVEEQGVQKLIDQYEDLVDDKHYFFFSGTYFYHNFTQDPERFLLNDYSARLHFLSIGRNDGASLKDYLDRAKINLDTIRSKRLDNVEEYMNSVEIDPRAIPFKLDPTLSQYFIDKLPSIGANVFAQPISGAGLCISQMAIVQLPPFANVARNIMWIDDSIKRTLHEGIGDLNHNDICSVTDAKFAQNRYRDGVTLSDVLWAYNTYLPRLVYGCLMHGLMYDESVNPPAGPYANSFVEYMRARRKPTVEDRIKWTKVAIERINVMKEMWSNSIFSSNPAGQMLSDFAVEELEINRSGRADIIREIVRKPTADINQLCQKFSLPPERNAGAYIVQVISDLQRYIELMELWPYIIRTIDFETRTLSPELEWLVRD